MQDDFFIQITHCMYYALIFLFFFKGCTKYSDFFLKKNDFFKNKENKRRFIILRMIFKFNDAN